MNLSFLKKVGQAAVSMGAAVTGLGPMLPIFEDLIGVASPTAARAVDTAVVDIKTLSEIVLKLQAAGAVAGIDGPTKLKMATPLVAQAILQSMALSKHGISDPEKFQLACQEYAQATVDFLDSLKGDHVQVVSAVA